MSAPTTAEADTAEPGDQHTRLWNAVVAGDARAATDTVLAALAAGLEPESVLLDLIGGVQRRVGQEWAAARIDVAQEHTATAINDRVITAVSLAAPPVEPHRGRVTVACVDGEWHALPARLLAEVLTLRGFAVDFLGAQVPTPHLVEHLHRTGPEAVALSGSLAPRLPTAHATINACTATGTPVLAGGAAFGVDGAYARLLGAHWAPDARAAADLLAAGSLARPEPPGQAVDQLPHLADQEYTMITLTRGELVKAVYTGLEEQLPAMRSYTEDQRERTAEDLAHIVDFLCAALYTDADAVFGDFLEWTADVLGVRGVPRRAVLPGLDLLATELREFPRARRILDAGRARLAPEPGPTARTERAAEAS
ncbi:cobalamin B12-binding domain-containing protein [Pseudonocardia xishanensis]|uniref:Cobalamin B12-binding domain-containing protein n=1 Tax=Pseudonocardia xishanensis TaxID=630995 RepID=A0ABP8S077_9PSEU